MASDPSTKPDSAVPELLEPDTTLGAEGSADTPMFLSTTQHLVLWDAVASNMFTVSLTPYSDKGFFVANGAWTCYRRNYFQIAVSFTVKSSNGKPVEEDTEFYVNVNGHLERVSNFKVGLDSKCGTEKKVPLVQCSAKREKGCQVEPPLVLITPTLPGQGKQIKLTSKATYKRLQFKASTSTSTSKRSMAQQHFNITCDLIVTTEKGTTITLATCESVDLTVRSKSSVHYGDGSENGPAGSQNPSPSPSPAPSFTGMANARFEPYGSYRDQDTLSPFSPRSNFHGMNSVAYQPSPAGCLYHSEDQFSPFIDFTSMSLRNADSPMPQFTSMATAQGYNGYTGTGFSSYATAGPVDLGFANPIAGFDSLAAELFNPTDGPNTADPQILPATHDEFPSFASSLEPAPYVVPSSLDEFAPVVDPHITAQLLDFGGHVNQFPQTLGNGFPMKNGLEGIMIPNISFADVVSPVSAGPMSSGDTKQDSIDKFINSI
ncbi:hypothetical protein HDV03_000514 [Kappamyces sp. JEL0829]|nr:hypothetical protein HDV03_000514 [Kappamyces sp. JEL0829]